ncbi:MAG: TIGR01777 family oxidoreductase [Planctomycetota bacterium]
MRIGITGSTGLVGSALVNQLLTEGHQVVRLVRRAAAGHGRAGGPDDGKLDAGRRDDGKPGDGDAAAPGPDGTYRASWDVETGALDTAALGNVEAIVHLAGENVAGGRWNDARKQRIDKSRGPATERLCSALAALPTPPRILVSASATGIYGDRGDEVLDEQSTLGPKGDFLADVARDWEAGTKPLESARKTRIVHIRIGIVLSREGGALQRMRTPFLFGVGGRLGSGKQWMSWISRTDLVRALLFALTNDDLHGPALAVAPTPVTNRSFTKTLGKVLRRPTILPVPAFALRLLFGEMSAILLGGQRAEPKALLQAGFVFQHPDLESALRHELSKE